MRKLTECAISTQQGTQSGNNDALFTDDPASVIAGDGQIDGGLGFGNRKLGWFSKQWGK